MNNAWHIAYTAFAVCAALLAVAAITFTLVVDTRPPLQGLIITPTNSPITLGQQLQAIATRTKVRDDCPIVSIRRVTETSTGISTLLDGRVWNGGPAGSTEQALIYDTQDLPAGQYVLDYELTYLCPYTVSHRYTGQVYFSIKEPTP